MTVIWTSMGTVCSLFGKTQMTARYQWSFRNQQSGISWSFHWNWRPCVQRQIWAKAHPYPVWLNILDRRLIESSISHTICSPSLTRNLQDWRTNLDMVPEMQLFSFFPRVLCQSNKSRFNHKRVMLSTHYNSEQVNQFLITIQWHIDTAPKPSFWFEPIFTGSQRE